MIPLIIKYPGCPKNKKITDVVSSLDIATTILSLLKIPYDKYKFEGLNLLNYIKGEKTPHRKVRTDTRYYFQPNKITSLRGNKFKYTYNFEKKPGSNEGFFDIENDRLEQNNLINSKNLQVTTKLDEFRREFKLSEKKGIELQNNYLGGKFEKLLEDTGIDNIERVLVFGTANVLFVNILLNKITKLLKNAKVDVIIKKKLAKEVNIESDKLSFIVSNLTCRDLRSRLKRLRKNKYNLVIIPLTDPLCVGYNSIFKIANKLEADKIMKVDYNMGLVKESNMWTAILKDFKKNLITDLYNPRPFASKLTVLMKRIIFKKDF